MNYFSDFPTFGLPNLLVIDRPVNFINQPFMSDHSISIVPKISKYPGNHKMAWEILEWLVARNIVEAGVSNCVLGGDGYSMAKGAEKVVKEPGDLPVELLVNGLEIITEKRVFHTGENGIDELICPACKQNLVNEDWDFFGVWQEQQDDNITCPLCDTENSIHSFTFTPEWGFSDLCFTFWNWSELTDSFIEEFKQKLECDVNIVNTWL